MFIDVTFEQNKPEAEYRAVPALSYSQLKHAKSAAHFKANLDEEKEASDDMLFGTLVHALAFGSEHKVIRKPDGLDLRTGLGKAWKEHNKDFDHLPTSRYDGAVQAVKNLGKDPSTRPMLNAAKFEVSAFATHQATGTKVKGRADMVLTKPDNTTAIADIKTMRSIEIRDIRNSILEMKYYIQAAMYMDLWGASEFWFICVESSAPYAVRTLKLGDQSIAKGRGLLDKAIKLLHEDAGKFSLPIFIPEEIEIPYFAL